jgi:hypothetical protein
MNHQLEIRSIVLANGQIIVACKCMLDLVENRLRNQPWADGPTLKLINMTIYTPIESGYMSRRFINISKYAWIQGSVRMMSKSMRHFLWQCELEKVFAAKLPIYSFWAVSENLHCCIIYRQFLRAMRAFWCALIGSFFPTPKQNNCQKSAHHVQRRSWRSRRWGWLRKKERVSVQFINTIVPLK